MLRRFRQRSYELEHLDTGDYTAAEYEGCLVELRRVNRWLGDAHALRASLRPELRRARAREFSLLDVGAGSGELLRVAAREARRRGWRARLVGLELNERSARAILEESRGLPEIASVRGDALPGGRGGPARRGGAAAFPVPAGAERPGESAARGLNSFIGSA
ncbi:MAG: hypothetical protein LC800_10130 [Acidobacteria bacterium]|nr:hypothetical protein [Acidobacteriota bacterium]